MLIEVRFLPLHRDWEVGTLSFLIAFQKKRSQVLRRKFLRKACKKLGEDLHLKGAGNNFYLNVFSSKCSTEREVRDLESEINLSDV